MASLLKLMRDNARSWWAYKHLPPNDPKIHQSIRSDCETLRGAYMIYLAENRMAVDYRPKADGTNYGRCSLSGYSPELWAEYQRLGNPDCPLVDFRGVSEEARITYCLSGPMVDDPERIGKGENHYGFDTPYPDGAYGSMARVHPGICVALAEAMGASVRWGNLRADKWRIKAAPTVARVKRITEPRTEA